MVFRLAILDPGHFHAALPLRSCNPRLAGTVQVHATDGPDLERFLAMVARFNARAADSTAWQLVVHRSSDPLATLLAAGSVDVAVLAGRNRGKLARIRALVEAGVHVLADKPWVVEAGDVRHLDALAASPAHWSDMMTERHEPWSALFAALARCPAVVGTPDPSRGPALAIATVHHLAKRVDGVPLVRPAWYFDVGQQGEGLIDVTTHLVDQALLIAGDGGPVRLLSASRWATAVPEADFAGITASTGFPAGMAGVADGLLQLMANGRLDFACGALSVRVQAEWRLRAADGSGDRHTASFHGTTADLCLEGGAASSLSVTPHGDPAAVEAAIARCQPAASLTRDGRRLLLRPAHSSGHETHFAQVLDGFLAGLDRAQPPAERSMIATRYRLLGEALLRAHTTASAADDLRNQGLAGGTCPQ